MKIEDVYRYMYNLSPYKKPLHPVSAFEKATLKALM